MKLIKELFEAKSNAEAASAAENIYKAYDTAGTFWSEAKIKRTLALAYNYGVADTKGVTRPAPVGLPKKKVKEPEVKRDPSKFDKKLSKYWEDYFLANYEWDYFTDHGGGSTASAEKKAKRLYDKVKTQYSKKLADRMAKWVEEAYERAADGRYKKWDQLIAGLPDEVDSTWIKEKFL